MLRKNLFAIVLGIIATCVVAPAVKAQSDLIPPIKWGDYKLEIWALNKVEASTANFDNGDHFEWSSLRVWTNLDTPDPKLNFRGEVELVKADQHGSNWLRQLYAQYKLNDDWTVRAGRMFLAGPYWTAPPFTKLETVQFPREPWCYYGYGIQVQGNLGLDWSLITDVTGAAGRSFDDIAENCSGIENSGSLRKKFGTEINAGFDWQISEDALKIGGDAWWSHGPLAVNGEVYASFGRDGAGNTYGGYIFGHYEVTKWFLPHVQFDYQYGTETGGNLQVTPGALWKIGGNRCWIITDWQVRSQGESALVAALEFRL